MGGSKAEVKGALDALRSLIDLAGFSRREVERRLTEQGNGVDLTRLFGGKLEPKLRHVYDICGVIGIHPLEFFRLVFKEPERRSPLLGKLEALFAPGRLPPVSRPPAMHDSGEDLGDLLLRRVAELKRLVEQLTAQPSQTKH